MIQHTTKWKFTAPEEIEKAATELAAALTVTTGPGGVGASTRIPGLWARKFGFHQGTCEACLKPIGGDAAVKGGKVSKGNRRVAWEHLQTEGTREAVTTAPMELIGKIIKKRVTNEVWIFSAYGDIPEEISDRLEKNHEYNAKDIMRSVPWILAIKTSTGWRKWFSRYTFREQAYGAGLEVLNEAYIDGHEIEMASSIDMDTIQVPLGAVEIYLTALVQEAQDTDKPKDLIALQVRLKKARGMLELLEAAQELVENKLVGIESDPDPGYTIYEWKPPE